MNKHVNLVLLIFLISPLFLSACNSTASNAESNSSMPDTIPTEYVGKINPFTDSAAVQAGKAAFDNTCATCHGTSGKGDGPAAASLVPGPANLIAFRQTVGDDFLFWRISTGKEGTSMVGWNTVLSEKQIWQVVAYIRSLE